MMIVHCSYSSSSSDDRSISSTVEAHIVDNPTKIALKGCHHRRRVTFQENADVFYTSPFEKKSETKRCWYTASDFQHFKNLHMNALKMVVRAERENKNDPQSYLPVLERVFDVCCQQDSTVSSVPLNDYQRLHQLMSDQFYGRIGLEKTCVSCIRLDRKRRRQQLMDAVMILQQHKDYLYASADQRALSLALMAQDISRTPRLFAAYIAAAAATEPPQNL